MQKYVFELKVKKNDEETLTKPRGLCEITHVSYTKYESKWSDRYFNYK